MAKKDHQYISVMSKLFDTSCDVFTSPRTTSKHNFLVRFSHEIVRHFCTFAVSCAVVYGHYCTLLLPDNGADGPTGKARADRRIQELKMKCKVLSQVLRSRIRTNTYAPKESFSRNWSLRYSLGLLHYHNEKIIAPTESTAYGSFLYNVKVSPIIATIHLE